MICLPGNPLPLGGVSVMEDGVVSVTVISLSSCGLTEHRETSGGLKNT